LRPPRNLYTTIRQWVLRIFEIDDSRPDQTIYPLNNTLQDPKDGIRFAGNSRLSLVVKRTVEAIQIQVYKHRIISVRSILCRS
jgi:hypothetical protein